MSIQNTRLAVGKAKELIKDRRGLLQDSESQTRAILVEPVLQALGWDTADPYAVRQEYPMNGGFADYALLNREAQDVLIIVEVKRLGDERLEKHIPQIEHYAGDEANSVEYGVITNGNIWRVFKKGDGFMRSRNILAISIIGDPDEKCSQELVKTLGAPAVPDSHRPNKTARQRVIPQTGLLWNEALWR